MSKTLKSVRIDDDILAYYQKHKEFMKKTMEQDVSFSALLEVAIPYYLAHHYEIISYAMRTGSIVERGKDGIIHRFTYTDEQIKDAHEMQEEATEMMLEMEERYVK